MKRGIGACIRDNGVIGLRYCVVVASVLCCEFEDRSALCIEVQSGGRCGRVEYNVVKDEKYILEIRL